MPSKKPPNDSNQPPTEEASQLPLDLGALVSAEPLEKPTKKRKKDPALKSPGRVERVTSRDAFVRAIFSVGGDNDALRISTGIIYRVAFDLSTAEFSQYFGLKSGNRDQLPETAQNVLMLHELLNAEAIKKLVIPAELTDQDEINQVIFTTVRRQTHATERFFVSVNLFTREERLRTSSDQPAKKSLPISLDTEWGPVVVDVLKVENEDDIPY